MTEEEISIRNTGAPDIRADLRTESPSRALPVIILSHGFLGHKRWGWFPYLSASLAGAGFHTVTISFSMNGIAGNEGRIDRPEQFARNTVSRELADLKAVIRFVESDFPFPVDNGSVGLFGHSRGGAVSILAAPEFSSVKSLVTWSTPSRLDRYTESRKEDWKRTGRLAFRDSGSEGFLHLDYSYYLDIDRNREQYDLPSQVARLDIPHLIIHGRRDAAVTLKEARRLTGNNSAARVEFKVIEGCGHTFGVSGPMSSPPPRELEEALEKTVEWFRETIAA